MKYRKFVLVLILAIIFSQIPTLQAHGQAGLFKTTKKSDQPVVVKGDKVEYFHDQKKVVGRGNVSITYGDVELKCDRITVYTDTKEAICEGNVRISQPGASMEGEKINYNFAKKTGYALESKVKYEPFYGAAKRAKQTGDKKFKLEEGYITTCDLEKPHYRIQAKEVQIFLNDKIIAKHIFFYVFDIPVLYMPIYVQPLGEKYPDVTVVHGRSNDWGYYLLTAWRYYFNENSKGFIRLDYREKKGLAEGIDYFYNTKELGKGIVRFYYTRENDFFAIEKKGSVDDRWRLNYRHTINLPEDTVCMIEFNKMSDKDVIKDYLYREYEENPSTDNYILIETTKQNYTFNLLARKRIDNFFTVVERLPEVKLAVNNQRLWDTKFYYFSENSITNFIKRYDESDDRSPDESVRMDNYHKLSYVAKLFRFLNVTPFVATRQTFYSLNKWKDESQLRSIYETGFDVSTKFYRIFDTKTNFLDLDINRLRHIITPTIEFLHRHQPTISPSNLHQFDEIDNIDTYNGFELSLENKLQTKRPEGEGMKTVDLATLIISTDYPFRLKKGSLWSKGDGRFGDFKFQLELRPYMWLSIDSDMTLDHKDYNVKSANVDVFVNRGKEFTLGLGHRYESTESQRTSQFTGQMFYKINDDWKVRIYERYDIASEKWEEQEYIIYKDLHCWLGELSLNIRNNEYTVMLVFRLKAFPDMPIGLLKTTYQRPYPGGRR